MINVTCFTIVILLMVSNPSFGFEITKEESDYLDKNKVVTIAILDNQRSAANNVTNSKLAGVMQEYIRILTENLVVNVRYKSYRTVEDLLLGVESGESDLAIGYAKTSSRKNRFLFSEPIYNNVIAAWYREGSLQHQNTKDLKWACVRKTSYCEYLYESGYKNVIEVERYDDLIMVIQNSIVDVALMSYEVLVANFSTIGNINGSINIEEKSNENSAHTIYNNENSVLMQLVYKNLRNSKIKYYNKLSKTDLKQLFLSEVKSVFRYSLDYNNYPYAFIDKESGKISGVIPDILDELERYTLFKFQYVHSSGRNLEDMLGNNEIDFVPHQLSLSDYNFITSKPYLKIYYDEIEFKINSKSESYGLLNKFGSPLVSIYDGAESPLVYSSLSSIKAGIVNDELKKILVSDKLSDFFVLSDLYDVENIEYNKAYSSLLFTFNEGSRALKSSIEISLSLIPIETMDSINNLYDKVVIDIGYNEGEIHLAMILLLSIISIAIFVFKFVMYCKNRQIQFLYCSSEAEKEKLKRLKEIFDITPNIVFALDSDCNIVLSNENFKKIVKTKDDIEKITKGLLLTMRRNDYSHCLTASFDYKFKRDYFVGVQFFRGLDCDEMYLFSLTDVTDKKEYEEKLVKVNKEIKKTIKCRETFFALMTHELRTPISAIMGLSEFLMSSNDRRKYSEFSGYIMSSAEQLKNLVDDILDVCQIEAGQMNITPGFCDIYRHVEPIAIGFRESAKNKNIKLDISFLSEADVLIRVDKKRVLQIISNLLSNAIKFTHAGEVRLTIKNDNEFLIIEVKDSGIGMTSSQLDKIYTPFKQVNCDLNREYESTGLGMSIVYRLVKLMNGEISISSLMGRGTDVVISIPIKIGGDIGLLKNEEIANKKENFELNSNLSLEKRLSGKILLIDDDRINRVLVKCQLELLGVSVFVTDNSNEFMSLLSLNSFDALIIDCHMPIVSGLELIKLIRAMGEREKRIPIIGYTADNSRSLADRFHQVGGDGLIYKPSDINMILSILSEYLPTIVVDEHLNRLEFDDSRLMMEVIIKSYNEELMHLQNDTDSNKNVAHRLRGSASLLGYQGLIAASEALEMQPSSRTLKEALVDILIEIISKVESNYERNYK